MAPPGAAGVGPTATTSSRPGLTLPPALAAVPTSAVWSYPGTLATPAAPSAGPTASPATPAGSSTGVVLKGCVPADPGPGFSGLLFLVGERFVPGSSVLITFQGMPVALLPGVFFSSEILGVDVLLAAPGAYTFAAVAPDGTTSRSLSVNVAPPSSSSPTAAAPAVHMIWPPAIATSFVGTAWILGENFLPGTTLVGTGPTGTFAEPLLFVNERTLGWPIAAPLAGSYTLQVVDPLLRASPPLTLTIGAAAPPGTPQPAPTLVYAQSSVASPFLGTVRVFGTNFLPGAVLELTDTKSGAKTTTPLIFLASDEVWWMLVYPGRGSYEALVRNPDGQATPSWSFTVN